MTRIRGIIDFVGPSGGAVIAEGIYHLDAASGVFINAVQDPIDNSNVIVSGQSIYLLSTDLYIHNHGAVNIGDSNWTDGMTPTAVGIHSLTNIELHAKQLCFWGTQDNAFFINSADFLNGTISMELVPGRHMVHSISAVEVSGVTEFDIDTGMIGAQSSGMHSTNNIDIFANAPGPGSDLFLHATRDVYIAANDDIFISAPDVISFITSNGKRADMNGSGIATIDDLAGCYWHGKLTAAQPVTATDSSLLWDTVSSQGTYITHTNGTANIFLEGNSKYAIDIVLESDYSIGGHLQSLTLSHYNGFTITILNTQQFPTSPQIRNWSFVRYIVDVDGTAGQYIFAKAKNTVAQDGKVYKVANTVMIVTKIGNG